MLTLIFKQALKLDPNLAMAHASLGMAYFREGKANAAQASLERAVTANSQNYLAHYYYALLLSRHESMQDRRLPCFTPEQWPKYASTCKKLLSCGPTFLSRITFSRL